MEALLGRGSMGAVYRARHTLTDTEVALKLINPTPGHHALVEARFRREVSVSAHIGHDGIVRVLDAGREPDGTLYLAMELLEGETFQARSERPAFTAGYGLNVIRALLEPLAAAHAAGIVHRDVKPENILLHRRADGREQVKLLDFGIARDPRHQSGTRTDVGLGTPYYMSPEQATNAREVTPASDVWSVGVMLYWLLSGRLPFEADTPFNTLTLVCTTPHAPLTVEGGETTRALVELVERALAKDPALRPADAGAMLEALTRILGPRAQAASWSKVDYGSNPNLEAPWAPPEPAQTNPAVAIVPALPPVTQPNEAPMASLSLAAPVSAAPPRRRWGLPLLIALLLSVVVGLGATLVLRETAPAPSTARRPVAPTPPTPAAAVMPAPAAMHAPEAMPPPAPEPPVAPAEAQPTAADPPQVPPARAVRRRGRVRSAPRRATAAPSAAPVVAAPAEPAPATDPAAPADAGVAPEAPGTPPPDEPALAVTAPPEPEAEPDPEPEPEPEPEPPPKAAAKAAPPPAAPPPPKAKPEPRAEDEQPFLTF